MQLLVTLEVCREQLFLRTLPMLPEEPCSVILQAVFSEEWDAFPAKYAVLWREGEEVLRIPLAESAGEIPWDFAASEAPFYLCARGERGKDYLSTNQVCGAFVKKPQ